MKRVDLKLRARRFLAENALRARLTVALYLLFRLGAVAVSAFFVYCIFLLPEFLKSEPYGVPSPFYYALFGLCLSIVFGFSAVLNYLLHRWFYFADSKESFFKILPVRFQLKIVYLHFLKISRNISAAMFYLLPFLATLLFILLKLRTGIDSQGFALLLILEFIYLILGLYFLFVSRQKTAFLNAEISDFPRTPARKLFENTCKRGRCFCINLAKLKLSFLLWYALCLLIVPIIFVMPYCLATTAEYRKTELESQALQ